MAKRSRPMTPAEERLVEAAIAYEATYDGVCGAVVAKRWETFDKAVAAVVRERRGRE